MGENVKLVPLLMRTLSQMKSVHLSAQTYSLKHDYIGNPIMDFDAEHLFIYRMSCYLLIIRLYNLLSFVSLAIATSSRHIIFVCQHTNTHKTFLTKMLSLPIFLERALEFKLFVV